MIRNLNNNGRSRRRLRGVAVVLVLGLALAGCQGQAHGPESAAPAQPVAASAAARYTCPMHPQIVRAAPGQCPICRMDLVPKVLDNAAAVAEPGLSNVLSSPDQAVLAALATVRPAAAALGTADTLVLPGVVEYDPRRSRAVAARFGGRIERLLVRYNYQPVRRGQKLLELYSPELVTAEQEYIFLLTNDAANTVLVSGARQKLRLLGLTDGQLRELARTRRPGYRVALFSPYDGYVVETPAAPAAPNPAASAALAGGGGMGGGMSGGGAPAPAPAPAAVPASSAQLSLTEGTYVATGQTLFQVVNTAQVWGIFQPTLAELARLRPGQQLRVRAEGTSLPPRTARLELVEPEYRAGASVASVRVYLPNPAGRLRQGQRLRGQLIPEVAPVAAGSFWLPRTAVLDLGTRQVVFVRRGTTFVAVPVGVGQRTATQVQVLSGLAGTEDVAANGQYLIDSEGFVQTTAPDATAPTPR
ncbi:efflux RND transporter periplasmic adaptor subunit [Hymenobacter rubripertinctus]|uniref:efflux RND transporter periplasmic adaptor subunit n=1 Tax=Hymenobacter rubripertinctus TaxID=2029981 RepID=UPI00364393D4